MSFTNESGIEMGEVSKVTSTPKFATLTISSTIFQSPRYQNEDTSAFEALQHSTAKSIDLALAVTIEGQVKINKSVLTSRKIAVLLLVLLFAAVGVIIWLLVELRSDGGKPDVNCQKTVDISFQILLRLNP